MKYVKTFRQQLVEAEYPVSIMNYQRNRDFYQAYPAPKLFNLEDTQLKQQEFSKDDMQLLAIWYCRGTQLKFKETILQHKHPVDSWGYQFIPQVPKHYILMGKTTSQLAYDYGKQLIDRCTKASRIPFSVLELAYKKIMIGFWPYIVTHRLKMNSPNEKTYLEVKAEMDTLKDIRALTFASSHALQVAEKYNDEELLHYSKVFGIELPRYSLAYDLQKTEHHGFAIKPCIKLDDSFSIASGKPAEKVHLAEDKSKNRPAGVIRYENNNAGYAAFDDDRPIIPTTLRRDAQPVRLQNKAFIAQLAEQIDWYLATFNETHDPMLLAEGWGFCNNCGFYQLNEGCDCGLHTTIELEELNTIQETYHRIWNGVGYIYQTTNGDMVLA